MTDKQIINGLKYEKLSEDQLYDLSSWELVDIILAYRKDYKAKEQECDRLKMKNRILETECNEMRNVCNEFEQYYEPLTEGHNKLKQTLTEIKEIAQRCGQRIPLFEIDEIAEDLKQILQKISEVIPDEKS